MKSHSQRQKHALDVCFRVGVVVLLAFFLFLGIQAQSVVSGYDVENIPAPTDFTAVAGRPPDVTLPVLYYGQKVVLNNGFFRNTPAVVVGKIRPDIYEVRTLVRPGTTVRINPKITLAPSQR